MSERERIAALLEQAWDKAPKPVDPFLAMADAVLADRAAQQPERDT